MSALEVEGHGPARRRQALHRTWIRWAPRGKAELRTSTDVLVRVAATQEVRVLPLSPPSNRSGCVWFGPPSREQVDDVVVHLVVSTMTSPERYNDIV